ncbi:hypothetical protein [Bacteroides cellulosilyticus]|nr:hypothetical protein [Bacteroides cellulosilyticus]
MKRKKWRFIKVIDFGLKQPDKKENDSLGYLRMQQQTMRRLDIIFL